MTADAHRKTGGRGIRGGHVLAAMLAFFAVIIVADAIMIYNAVSTFGGLETANAYRDGLAYNKRIVRAERQAESGWRDSIEVVPDPMRLRISLQDHEGSVVAGKNLVVEIGRPATNHFDARLSLSETEPGLYEGPIPDATEGSWIVHLKAFASADRAGEPMYQAKRRLWIKP